ncbi:Rne/Rng family ribonuclease [Phaeovibrio sulfidiphilus]|uniref:Ribonuclease E n=1 Tax=Phaeovibrio sulfidiphilus TaxID=1220600 RepID=A0A8J6YME1_9PROT|nr:ribonuclease E/G [Phaeovibrio sulfidiphilus]MBE1237285.1 Rne/Rng family ribonuclease [Phaeovibrio sulfidiphilus]
MTKRMLIDATHPEETRVVVLDGSRLEEFDVETSTKKQNKGNIYLAKIVRVEPSLQAAFVDYGGNRHGFLAFSEIHPDYYQISDDDRAQLIAEQEELARAEAEEEDDEDDAPDDDQDSVDDEPPRRESGRNRRSRGRRGRDSSAREDASGSETPDGDAENDANGDGDSDGESDAHAGGATSMPLAADGMPSISEPAPAANDDSSAENENDEDDGDASADSASDTSADQGASRGRGGRGRKNGRSGTPARPRAPSKVYRIQDVIKRRQIVLVQVVKEERGNKGAALTTYLSLAGRYCVFVPNTTRGGGVSRKITNAADRKRLKTIMSELNGPRGSAIILRTAGSERSKAEIKRDHDYLLRTWETIREGALASKAPCLIHEEGSLIKHAIRDIYTRDIDEVLVEGDQGYRAAKDFMRMLTPSHARKVQPYKDDQMPLFHRFQVENQMDAMLQPIAQLKSGGYLVISQTEALVAIDVNSGRSTRERNIDETAYKTNLEAADEIARQLRLRDLAGLIVIDFIDMDDPKHNQAVERRLKDALKSDRARIQVGHISSFGLLEMSRQRLRPSLIETSFRICPHCRGTGMIRSVESTALYILRMIEEDGIRRKYAEITVWVPTDVALYILNRKRDVLGEIEAKYGLRVFLEGDDSLLIPDYRIERTKFEHAPEKAPAAAVAAVAAPALPAPVETAEVPAAAAEADAGTEAASDEPASEAAHTDNGDDGDGPQSASRKRRRRRRRKRADGSDHPEDNGHDDADNGSGDDNGADDTPAATETGEDVTPVAPVAADSLSADADADGSPADGDDASAGAPGNGAWDTAHRHAVAAEDMLFVTASDDLEEDAAAGPSPVDAPEADTHAPEPRAHEVVDLFPAHSDVPDTVEAGTAADEPLTPPEPEPAPRPKRAGWWNR